MKWAVVCVLFCSFMIGITCKPVAKESGRISPEIICRQAFIIGECGPATTFWSYDPSKGKCREGCGSNENKFVSKTKCELTCKGIFDRNEPNDSEEIRINAFERVNDPTDNTMEPDLLI